MASSAPTSSAVRAATRLDPYVYAVLRIASGAMFLLHGTQKLLGVPPGGHAPPFGSQLWIGGLLELVTGALIALGLFTRAAAFVASGMMAVAYFQFHWRFGAASFWPVVNKGELAALYCLLFLLFWARGAGVLSLDARLRRAGR